MKKKFFIGVFIVALIGLIGLSVYVYKVKTQPRERYIPPQLNAPIEIPDTGTLKMNEITDFEKPVAVMFYVDWCTYCRRFMPIFGEVSKALKDKYTFAVINCDYPENIQYVEKFHIVAFPSVFIFDKKYDYSTPISSYATTKKQFMIDELNKYIKLRSRIK